MAEILVVLAGFFMFDDIEIIGLLSLESLNKISCVHQFFIAHHSYGKVALRRLLFRN